MNQRILIDYFVASWKIHNLEDGKELFLFDLLGKPPDAGWEMIKSYYGLSQCYFYEGIKIHYSDDLVILDCSGRGCRTLENEFAWNWEKQLYEWMPDLISHQEGEKPRMHIARLDVACDLLDSDEITMKKLFSYVRAGKFTCRSEYHTIVEGNKESALYFGSPRSDRRLRIYDKALEQGLLDQKWIRFEFQLRNDNALSFLLNFFKVGSIGDAFYGVLHDYVNFTELPPMEKTTGKEKF